MTKLLAVTDTASIFASTRTFRSVGINGARYLRASVAAGQQ
jgi:hypothetical protein